MYLRELFVEVFVVVVLRKNQGICASWFLVLLLRVCQTTKESVLLLSAPHRSTNPYTLSFNATEAAAWLQRYNTYFQRVGLGLQVGKISSGWMKSDPNRNVYGK